MRATGGDLSFRPQLPSGITRLTFRMRYRDRVLRLAITSDEAEYELLAGGPLTIRHHGEQVVLAGGPVVRGIPPTLVLPCPRQPEGRVPLPRAEREPARPGLSRQAGAKEAVAERTELSQPVPPTLRLAEIHAYP
jgi:alpha,alpha-trehalose phosphorylase